MRAYAVLSKLVNQAPYYSLYKSALLGVMIKLNTYNKCLKKFASVMEPQTFLDLLEQHIQIILTYMKTYVIKLLIYYPYFYHIWFNIEPSEFTDFRVFLEVWK